jgi:hypothetical protein
MHVPVRLNFATPRWARVALSLAAAAVVVACLPSIARAYSWPVKPFDEQHAVRGNFGDPRTMFSVPPTPAGLFRGAGSFSFHQGVDISAPDGADVYPVADGIVSRVNSQTVVVDSGHGNRFEYWHVLASVKVGERVTARSTVLGRILRGAGHVHLTEIDLGRVTNPLLVGHLTPYRDTTVPKVASIRIQSGDDGPALMATFLRGRVDLIAEAYDAATLPVPGEWHDLPVTPAVVSWRVDRWDGKVVVPERLAWDARTHVPANSGFWGVYARGTYQNMAVFGKHFSWLQPGCYLFRLDGSFDTRRLPDGVYQLIVIAADVAGNSSSRTLRFSVHNAAGWVGV